MTATSPPLGVEGGPRGGVGSVMALVQRARRSSLVLLVALVATLVATVAVVRHLEVGTLREAGHRALTDPAGLVLATSAFAAAFALRAALWCRVLPDLGYGQSWAAMHVSLAGNHVLPLRLGEPLRAVSASRRAGVPWRSAAATTLTLRAADVVALAAIGAAMGPRLLTRALGAWGWLLMAVVVAAGAVGLVWTTRLRGQGGARLRRPGPLVLLGCAAAWPLEAVLVWQAARWAGLDLSLADATLVTATAVIAQVVAIAPGGLGTYEVAFVAALTSLGHPAAVALTAALVAHALKTAYSLLVGVPALWLPRPGLVGRLRLRAGVGAPAAAPPPGPGPVVLFLPAFDEEATVADVVRRVPAQVHGRAVVCVVVDDGSSDATAERAAEAGAVVMAMGANRGLGAAVRAGLADGVGRGAAVVAFCDADGEYAPEELGDLVGPILRGEADYVVGSRFAGRIDVMRPHRRLGNVVLTRWVRWMARQRVTDGQSGYRALSAAAAAEAEVIHDYNYAQVLTLDLLAKGHRYLEVPISYAFRAHGRSFVKLGRYLRAVVPAVHAELNRPDGVSHRGG